MLVGKNFTEIDHTTLQGLVDAGATESLHLEFKRDAYGNSDSDKKEFLKDISSFANGLGGYLLIGVDEKDGVAVAVTPLTVESIDQELLRLENIARTGIEPAIAGLRMKRIAVGQGEVIVVHVPRSFNPPHRVMFRNRNRYYGRNSSGTYELSLEELRMLFGQQRTIEERAKTFVNERFLRIQANDGALPLPVDSGGMVMHLVPLPDFGVGRRHDIAVLREQSWAFRPIGSDRYSARINLDGVVFHDGGEICEGYTQVIRNGSVEATTSNVIVIGSREERFVPSGTVPPGIIASLSSYMKGMRALDASPPIMLQLSFFGMNGVGMAVHESRLSPRRSYNREELHLPPTVISDFRDDDNYERIVAEQMHFLWNAFGYPRCEYFDDEGTWVVK